ncbi:MAG TPA: SpoIIE family protein phosphatase [Acidimicrobiales bacterium]|nr:SpoIIE family protein phosphatase [Acidimicrobiales bacterium]
MAGHRDDQAGPSDPIDDRALDGRDAIRIAHLAALASALTEALSPDDVLAVVSTHAVTACGAVTGAVVTADGGDETTVDRGAVGADILIPADVAEPAIAALRAGRPAFRSSLAPTPEVAAAGPYAVAGLPFVIHGRGVGGLLLRFAEPQRFDAGQRTYLGAIADLCASSLERARLWDAERRARQRTDRAYARLELLAEAGRAASSTLDPIEALERVTALAVPQLADLAVAFLHDGDALRCAAVVHRHPDVQRGLGPLVGRSIPLRSTNPAAECARTGEPRRVLDLRGTLLHDLPEAVRAVLRPLHLAASMVVPVRSAVGTEGVLVLASSGSARVPSDRELDVAVELGIRVGTAVEHGRRFQDRASVAEALQRAVLPESLPRIPGLDLAAEYLPASVTSGREVGGDWYDAFRLRDGRHGLAVGDVSGHGLTAAATMSRLRNALRIFAVDGAPPDAVLGELNRFLHDTGSGELTSAVYGVVDHDLGALTWASAGHPPPFLVDAAGRVSELDRPQGAVLGAFVDRPYERCTTTLAPGDTVVLYTDGLVERRGESIDEGLARLARSLAREPGAAATGAEAVASALCRSMLADRPRGDDVCLLVARRR